MAIILSVSKGDGDGNFSRLDCREAISRLVSSVNSYTNLDIAITSRDDDELSYLPVHLRRQHMDETIVM